MAGAVLALATMASTAVAPLTLKLNYNDFAGFRNGAGTAVTAGQASITVSGGVAPYTYSWARVSGDSSIFASAPTANSTYFSRFFSGSPDSADGVWHCTVTDTATTSVVTDDVFVTLQALDDTYA